MKLKNEVKKAVSCLLSVIIFSVISFNYVLPICAVTDEYSDYYTVPSMKEMLSTCNTWSGNGLLKVSQIDNDGGVRITANGGFQAVNYPDYNMQSRVLYSLDDLTLRFNGYFNSNYFSVRFCFILSKLKGRQMLIFSFGNSKLVNEKELSKVLG